MGFPALNLLCATISFTHSFFHFQTSWMKFSLPRSWRLRPLSLISFFSTTTWVAMPAWSQPGFHKVVSPRILCLDRHRKAQINKMMLSHHSKWDKLIKKKKCGNIKQAFELKLTIWSEYPEWRWWERDPGEEIRSHWVEECKSWTCPAGYGHWCSSSARGIEGDRHGLQKREWKEIEALDFHALLDQIIMNITPATSSTTMDPKHMAEVADRTFVVHNISEYLFNKDVSVSWKAHQLFTESRKTQLKWAYKLWCKWREELLSFSFSKWIFKVRINRQSYGNTPTDILTPYSGLKNPCFSHHGYQAASTYCGLYESGRGQTTSDTNEKVEECWHIDWKQNKYL